MRYLYLVFISLLLCLPFVSHAQAEISDTDGIIQPAYPGGQEALLKFIDGNLKYPQSAIDKKVEGYVTVSFIVGKDGKLKAHSIAEDIGEGCGEEALRIVKAMPSWTPGTIEGEIRPFRFNLPIYFSLED